MSVPELANAPPASRLATSLALLWEGMLAMAAFTGVALFSYRGVLDGQRSFLVFLDGHSQTYPWHQHVAQAWREGKPPLWDFFSHGGTSFIGELQTAALYPVAILWSLLGARFDGDLLVPASLDLLILLHHALAAMAMYVFARQQTRAAMPAFLAGLAFALVGTVAHRSGAQANLFFSMAWTPLALALLAHGLERRGVLRPAFVGAGFVLALSVLAGHFNATVMAAVAMLLWVAVHCVASRSLPLLRLAGIAVLILGSSLLFAAPQVLLAVEHQLDAFRYVGDAEPVPALQRLTGTETGGYGFPLEAWRALFDYRVTTAEESTPYITLVGLGLAVLGLTRRHRAVAWAVISILVAVVLAVGDATPVARLAWKLPGIGLLREPERMLYVYQLAAAMLVACGARQLGDLLLRTGLARALGSPALVLGTLGVVMAVETSRGLNGAPPIDHPPTERPARRYALDDPMLAAVVAECRARHGNYRLLHDRLVLPDALGLVHRVPTMTAHRATIHATTKSAIERSDWQATHEAMQRLGVVDTARSTGVPVEAGTHVVLERGGASLRRVDDPLTAAHWVRDDGSRIPAAARGIRWGINTAVVTLEPDHAGGTLVLGSLHAPGWRARVDGAAAEVHADGHELATSVPAGTREVRFEYRPRLFFAGLALSGLGVLVWIAAWWLQRRRRAPAAA